MTSRRWLAMLMVTALLFGLAPMRAEAEVAVQDAPTFSPLARAFTAPGTTARLFGGNVVVAEKAAVLAVYDEDGKLLTKHNLDGPALQLAVRGQQLLVLTSKGTLYCAKNGSAGLTQVWKLSLSSGKSFSAEQAALLWDWDIRPDSAAAALGNLVYEVNTNTGQVQQQHALPAGATVVNLRWVSGYLVIHYHDAAGYHVSVRDAIGNELALLPAGQAVVEDMYTSRPYFLYVAPDDRQIRIFSTRDRTDEAYLEATDPVHTISWFIDLIIATGNSSLVWQDEVAGWYSDGTPPHGIHPILLDGHFVVTGESLALMQLAKVVWATALPDGDDTTQVLGDSGESGVLLKLNQDTIALYTSGSDRVANGRELAYSQAHVYCWQHPEAGPVSLELYQGEYNPYLDLRYTVRYQATGSSEWVLLEQNTVGGFLTRLNYPDVPAGQVKVSLTVQQRSDVNPELLPAEDRLAHSPLLFGFNLLQGLAGSVAAPPPLRAVNPGHIPYELWNGADVDSLSWQVQTAPGGMVDFYRLELPVPADASGNLTQVVPLTDEPLQMIQALAGDPNGAQSGVTIWVQKHLIKSDPRVAPQLSRQPAIAVQVPDASRFDLSQSEMLVDGVRIPLYADLKANRIYGVPSSTLPTGTRLVGLALRGADGTTLDAAEWPLEIIGERVAVLWLNQTNSLLNGQATKLDAAPYLNQQAATTMVPFRYVGDVMGAQVGWDSQTKVVTFRLKEHTVLLTIGSRTAHVDGQAVTMLTSPTLSNGRTLVPLRFVSEQLGAKVDWNGSQQQITITVAADPGE